MRNDAQVSLSSSELLFLADFEQEATRCREQGGGLSEFLRLPDVVRLQWPTDVVEHWLYDHAGNQSFKIDYGHVDLTQIDWHVEALSGKVLLDMPTGPSDGDLLEEIAQNPEHWISVRCHGVHLGVAQMWDVHGTWKRWPLVLDRSVLSPNSQGLQLVEGRTRLGVMRGRRRQGNFVAERHLVWIGRLRQATRIENNIYECRE